MGATNITISGLPGAGKGTILKLLEKEYGIKSFSVGDLRRQYALSRGMTIQELNALNDPNTDLEADNYQKQWIRAKTEGYVLEGRLSYSFFPESIRVFLTVDPIVGAKRILEDQRESETKALTLEQQVIINSQRCASDIERYERIYGINNCYDENQFDVIIDTTKRNPEQVMEILKAKIVDYKQKMEDPIPRFYLGHPTRAKDNLTLQATFERLKQTCNVGFFNPFKDNPAEKMHSLGEKDYFKLTKAEKENLAEGDLLAVLDKKIIGGAFIYNGEFTIATQMESLTAFFAGKLNYIVVTKSEKDFLIDHPFFGRIKSEIFPNMEELEAHLIRRRNDLFIDLRKARENWMKDRITQALYQEMKLNELLLGR